MRSINPLQAEYSAPHPYFRLRIATPHTVKDGLNQRPHPQHIDLQSKISSPALSGDSASLKPDLGPAKKA
jgi:hypothetical protein